ncbi:unnamed protein product [Brassicogethes aeneus]|uniref:Cilia- and flagella-associated protein 299 n=1 Tax=Brassicogethes aeneus TaxID=1431903 RepID=A0A9P0B513_BRAAE|nr:unnamed protein product [Brassicogethes aeneus]
MQALSSTPQIEADRRLLNFKDYEDYLDSLVTPMDKCYLRSTIVSRNIAELGYRSSGLTLSREQFKKRVAAVIMFLSPPYKPYELCSEGLKGGDPIMTELALRERPNRVGILSTIIFLRMVTKTGREISGYIDYHHRLTTTDFKPFFKSGKKIYPKPTDLGFYHWGKKVLVNDSLNYKALMDPSKGLIFQNRFDRKIIIVDPDSDPGSNTKKKRIFSKMYEHVVLFDHVVRQRI